MTSKDLKSLESLLRDVVKCLKHLHRVTGKWGLFNINPIEEKRWSKECWRCFGILCDVKGMMCDGVTYGEFSKEFIQELKDSEYKYVGKWKTATFPFEKVHVEQPKCGWNKSDKSCIGKPCGPNK